MDISNWSKYRYTANSQFNWSCPHCGTKSLELTKDKLVSTETQKSKNSRVNGYSEPEFIELNISGLFSCKSCNESVSFIAVGNPERCQHYDSEFDIYIDDFEISFRPVYINPTLHLFEIPKKCPKFVTAEIVNSFKLYWCDLPSCANKIRTSIEVLMDEFKVKKYSIRNHKRIPIKLHHRIEKFPKKEITHILKAIKWIGNIGSHKTTNFEPIDILETYLLLEHALQKLYSNDEKEIQKIAKEINIRKGKRTR